MGQSISRLVGIDQLNGRANEQFKMSRHILVTGGATVPFKELLLEAITPEFLAALKAHGFAHLHIQCGDYLDEMRKKTKEIGNVDGPEIDTFGSHPDLKALMEILCRGEAGVKSAGVVVGHAGTGTISDALEADCAMIIVANPNLMDNHQAKFAAEMSAEHANVVQGHLGKLVEAIPKGLEVIEEMALDDLQPLEEEFIFPLPEDERLKIFDQVIVNDF